MSWDLTGKFVKAMYVGVFPVYGKVVESRTTYGGKVKHYVELIEKLVLNSAVRESVTVYQDEIVAVM